jgi:hypothetical protein
MMIGYRIASLLLAAVLAGGTAHAQTADTPKPTWAELSAAQKSALQPLSGEWDKMDAARKQKWLDIGKRFAAMGPDEQQRLHQRMREWLAMTPEQRRQARENYTLSKKLDKSDKAAKWDEYQQLPEEQKRKLAAAAPKKNQLTNLPPKAQADARPAAPKRAAAPANAPAPAPASAPASAPAPASAQVPAPNAK